MDFYYQIKAKDLDSGFGSWGWPPLFSGMVSATDKKKAKLIIEDDYGRQFPLRVLKKDLEHNHYLLSIREIKEGDDRTRSLFDVVQCKQCESGFRQIDLYNDHNQRNKGAEFCSDECRQEHYNKNRTVRPDISGNNQPVIYQIYNNKTGMSYIGKTTQVFTLRWYQHFYQGGDSKFHTAISGSDLMDWEFKIVDVIDTSNAKDPDKFIANREQFWIDEFDSINNGYNSVPAAISPDV